MSEAVDLKPVIAAYGAFFEKLSPETLSRLDGLCDAQVRFRDPFNDVTGTEAFRRILARMFDDVVDPRFTILDHALSDRVGYLRWTLSFRSRKDGASKTIDGMSEIHFDQDGRVVAHLDHWDSGEQFYGRLPVLRHIIALIRRRLSINS